MDGVCRPASARPATVRGGAKHAQAAQPAAPRAEETPDRWTAGASPTEGPSPRKSPTSGGKSPLSPRGETRRAALSQLQTRDSARHSPRSAALRSPTITSDDELRGEDPISTVMRSTPANQRLRRPSRRRERGGSCAASCAPGDSRSNRKGPFSSFEHWQWRRRRCPALEGSTRFPTRTRILDPGWLLTTIGVVTGLQSTAGGAHIHQAPGLRAGSRLGALGAGPDRPQ
jgi:hypothetical protein